MDRRNFLQLAGGIVLAGASPNQAAADDFRVRDVMVSEIEGSLIDPEFSAFGRHMSWVDVDGNIWVNDVNANGRWFPKDGQEQMLDTDLVPVGSIRQGAEWAYARDGSRLVYTKLVNSTPRMFQARLVDGEWIKERMHRSKGRAIVQASKDIDDLWPRIIFKRTLPSGLVVFGWREIDDSETEEVIPFSAETTTAIWVLGERAIVASDGLIGQVVKYDVDTGELTCLTEDAYTKRWPRMFRDEFGAVLTAVLDNQWIGVYLEDGGKWSLAQILRPPSNFPFVFAPKLWLHAGIPYLSFLMSTESSGRLQNRQGAAEVWITEVTAGDPFYRKVNNPRIARIKDTEGVSLSRGAYVYYAQLLPDKRRLIHRCETGL